MLFGKPDASDDEIISALKKTNAWEFVDSLPGKLDEQVGAGGGKLSGG